MAPRWGNEATANNISKSNWPIYKDIIRYLNYYRENGQWLEKRTNLGNNYARTSDAQIMETGATMYPQREPTRINNQLQLMFKN